MDIVCIIDTTDEDVTYEYLIRKPVIDDLKYIQIVLTRNSEFGIIITYYYIDGKYYFQSEDNTVVDVFGPNIESIVEYLNKLKD